jgi:hypothetical protein
LNNVPFVSERLLVEALKFAQRPINPAAEAPIAVAVKTLGPPLASLFVTVAASFMWNQAVKLSNSGPLGVVRGVKIGVRMDTDHPM